ncbi:MAG: beta-lactamase family protein [Caulobacteraceae bacterium]|nr:beta-lactamase family protein [Caulobacteraceae bacterium]
MLVRATAACLLAICVLVPDFAVAQDRDRFKADLDAFIIRALDSIEAVPGLAVAVVDDSGVVQTAGFGLADVESTAPVTAQTPFYIASSTKSFTALAIAAIAARGDIDLDAPVSSWSSGSGLPADMASRVTLTDLLSHRSGIDNPAIAYRVAYTGDWSPETLWRLTAETRSDPEVPYGTFRYSNVGYNLATVLLEHRLGKDWQTLVRDEVLLPIGMAQTTARIDAVRASGQAVAAGHAGFVPGHPERSYLQKTDQTMHSAGGLVSTANDMARWLQVQINDGVLDGQRVLPAGLVASTHGSRVEQNNRFGPYTRSGYGLGWQVGRYGDDQLLHHFGNFAGSRAHVSFMPDRRLGVAVMINEDAFAGGLADLVANYVYDWFAGMPDLDAVYEARLIELATARDARRQGQAQGRSTRALRPRMLTLPDADYAGDYVSASLGQVHVRETGQGLEFSIGILRATASNFTEAESVRLELIPLMGEAVVFQIGQDGRPIALTYAGVVFGRR